LPVTVWPNGANSLWMIPLLSKNEHCNEHWTNVMSDSLPSKNCLCHRKRFDRLKQAFNHTLAASIGMFLMHFYQVLPNFTLNLMNALCSIIKFQHWFKICLGRFKICLGRTVITLSFIIRFATWVRLKEENIIYLSNDTMFNKWCH